MKQIVLDNFNNYVLFVSKEYGADIMPTLQAYYKIASIIQFEKVIKLHTKSSDMLWFNNLTDYLLDKSLDKLEQIEKMLREKGY